MKERSNILITGGAGYVGSACVQALCEAGHTVFVFDNLSNGDQQYVHPQATFIKGDILKRSALRKAFEMAKPEVVIHLAALKAVGESELFPGKYFSNNVRGTMNVLEEAQKHGVTHFLFSSTASVYKPKPEGIYNEEDELESASIYGSTKLLAEKAITEFARTGQIPVYTIFRYFNVAGDVGLGFREKSSQNILPNVLEAAHTGKELCIFGDDYDTDDGSGVRDYIHMNDLVEAHTLALEKKQSGIYNLGTGNGTSVFELIEAFEKTSGMKVPYVVSPRRPGDVARAIADASLAKRELGWEARFKVDAIMESLVTDKENT